MPDDITKRMRYFDRQFLRAKDFQDEQAYHLDRRWRHNRLLHTYGIAEGLEVDKSSVLGEEKMVLVTRGTAYDPGGFEIVLSADQKIDLSSVAVNPVPPVSYTSPLYLTITYTEEPSDPSTDPGINGSTRTSEPPLFQPSPTAPTDPNQLLLAVIERDTSNGNVTTIDTNPPGRRRAGTLPPGSIGSAELRDEAVQSRHIAPADPGTDQTLTSGSGVKTRHIKDQAIAAEKLADNAVTSRSIADGAVTELKVADNAVTSRAIADGAVSNRTLVDNVVTNTKIADNEVTSAKIAEADGTSDQDTNTGRGIKTAHLQDGAVINSKIANSAVTNEKISNLSYTKLRNSANIDFQINVPANQTITANIGAPDAFRIVSVNVVTENVFLRDLDWHFKSGFFLSVPLPIGRFFPATLVVLQNNANEAVTVRVRAYVFADP